MFLCPSRPSQCAGLGPGKLPAPLRPKHHWSIWSLFSAWSSTGPLCAKTSNHLRRVQSAWRTDGGGKTMIEIHNTETPLMTQQYILICESYHIIILIFSISIINMAWIFAAYVTQVWYQSTHLLVEGQQVYLHVQYVQFSAGCYGLIIHLCLHRLRRSNLPWCS